MRSNLSSGLMMQAALLNLAGLCLRMLWSPLMTTRSQNEDGLQFVLQEEIWDLAVVVLERR